ncbi:MAG: FtsW/RodA/SpoVE family cell cycle protein [Defluviitaleaceae bacterium]|nr:FtsW/RodA/SpoVE family cell cycle protein [Defluviitaleaceae bacterium]
MLRRQYASFDYYLLAAMLVMMVFGLIMIGSATRVNIMPSGPFNNQLVFIPLGLVLFFFAAFIDYHFIARFYVMIYVLCVGLLVGTLVYGAVFTPDANVHRWIFIGSPENPIVGMQPSEFAKVLMIIFLAKVVDKYGAAINSFKMLMFLAGSIAVPVVLIMVQPSLSASLVVLLICLAVLFAGNVGGKHAMYTMILLTPIAAFLAYDFNREEPFVIGHLIHDYQMRRIETILNPEAVDIDARFQIERSMAAIGSGQLLGKGLYQGTITQTARLPHAETDFIISIIGEEFGFVGLMAVLVLMLFIIARCMIIAATAPDVLGRLIATGVAMKLAFQSFINVGVVTELLPNTGVPFPFLSYGGSSLWTSIIAVGLAVNVHMSKSKSMFE